VYGSDKLRTVVPAYLPDALRDKSTRCTGRRPEGAVAAQARCIVYADRLMMASTPELCPPKPYISLLLPVLSRRCYTHVETSEPMTSILAPPPLFSIPLRVASCHPSCCSLGSHITRTTCQSRTCILLTSGTQMADDHAQSGNGEASSEDFYHIAKSAGTKMKSALQEVRSRTDDTEGYIKFEMKDHEEILRRTVEKFEAQVSHRSRRRN
jgi:hypothetical protein